MPATLGHCRAVNARVGGNLRVDGDEVERDEHQDGEPKDQGCARLPSGTELICLLYVRRE